MELRELKEIIDIDVDGSLARFGNMESFYIKFLKKFVDDKSFENLKLALGSRDIEKVGELAHTLKGVAGNLGLNRIYEYSIELMKLAKENEIEEIESKVKELENEMEKVVTALKNL